MIRRIDSKYFIEILDGNGEDFSDVNNIRIEIKSDQGSIIPEDEPTFIFRAKDRLAVKALEAYRQICWKDNCTAGQLNSLHKMIEEFRMWAEANPDKMKQPGCTMKDKVPGPAVPPIMKSSELA